MFFTEEASGASRLRLHVDTISKNIFKIKSRPKVSVIVRIITTRTIAFGKFGPQNYMAIDEVLKVGHGRDLSRTGSFWSAECSVGVRACTSLSSLSGWTLDVSDWMAGSC